MAFSDLASLKAMLGIPTADTSKDTALGIYLASAEKTVLDIFGLTSTAVTSYTDTIDVDDTTTAVLMLRRWPVVAITSVTEDGDVLASTVYAFEDFGALMLVGSGRYFACGRRTVVVVYTAGWATVPADLTLAVLLIAVHGYNTGPRAGLNSEKIGQYSYQLGGASVAGGENGGGGFGIPPEAERILANYRRVFTLPN